MKSSPHGVLTENISPRSALFLVLPSRLLGRLCLLGILVVLEYLFCFMGRGAISGHLKILGMTTDVYGQIPIFAFAVFLGLGYPRFKAQQENLPFGRILFAGHIVCMAAVFSVSLAARNGAGWLILDSFSYIKSAVYILGTVLLVFACIPPRSWIGAIRSTGLLWLYALLAGVAGWFFGTPVKMLWRATSTVQDGIMQGVTLDAVRAGLSIFLRDIVVDRATFTIGTSNYLIEIAPGCSGVEGLGLVLIFTSLWLWYFRKETRFPQALLLIPCALACSWLLNIVRLCALILLMNSDGSADVRNGLHATAGWISFTAIALGFSLATQKLSWTRKSLALAGSTADEQSQGRTGSAAGATEDLGEEQGESPAIRAYLVPFLAILAASFVSKAASGDFEWLYPLRFVVGAIVLWFFRAELKKLNWRFGWMAPLAGVAVFVVWIAPSWWTHQRAASPLGPALSALSPTARWAWIAIRVAAAVITVPIAEELAFRGYLARRFISQEFDGVSFSSLTLLPMAFSSVVFGVMHMQGPGDWGHLMVGSLAGLAFVAVLRWKGRMGDAVAAHAICNLLLAAWVLGTGDWAQW
jgi:exosortase E/protease (VPEID-CTERM system)